MTAALLAMARADVVVLLAAVVGLAVLTWLYGRIAAEECARERLATDEMWQAGRAKLRRPAKQDP